MSSPSSEELRVRLERSSDFELLKMATVEANDYRDDVLEAVRAELGRRGKTLPSTKEFLASLTPEELQGSDLFCNRCHKTTTDDALPMAGETFMRRLLPGTDPCSTCGAVVREHWLALSWMPLYRIAKYRVKEVQVPWPGVPKVIASRKVRKRRAKK